MTPPTTQTPTAAVHTPPPVHTLLAERHLSAAASERREAARMVRPLNDLRRTPETLALEQQVSAALLQLAEAREQLAGHLADPPELQRP